MQPLGLLEDLLAAASEPARSAAHVATTRAPRGQRCIVLALLLVLLLLLLVLVLLVLPFFVLLPSL
jgi:hypothetical protein